MLDRILNKLDSHNIAHNTLLLFNPLKDWKICNKI